MKGEIKMIARVTFIKYYEYEVETDDDSLESEDKAIDEAYSDFRAEVCCPVADTTYDEVNVDWM